jgi:DNA-binding PadR family transcriptional regulator
MLKIRNRMSKTKSEPDLSPDRDLYSGLIRLHVLHHAAEEPIFGLGMIQELARHGYKISPGSLYPLLHGLEQKGYLTSSEQRNGKSLRRVYRATAKGKAALKRATHQVRELFHELIEGH